MAGRELPPLLGGLELGPLQHRLDDRAVAHGLAVGPEPPDIVVERPIFFECRTLKRRVLAIAPDDREVVVHHSGAAVVEERGELPDLAHVLFGRRRDGVDLKARIVLLDLREGVVGLHRLLECVRSLAELVMEGGHSVER